MTAIFGLTGPHNPDDLDDMARRLAHRGRHCHIETVDSRLSVGAVGDVPEEMIFREGRVLAVAAGRLYETADEAGSRQSADNLAEMLHRRFDASGISGISGLNGDFAACVVRDGQMTLLRDYFGCMPLFWSRTGSGCVAFASEYKAICALQSFAPSVDRTMLQYLQSAKRIPTGRTLLDSVLAAKPGATTIADGCVTSYESFTPLVSDVRIRDEDAAGQVISKGFREATRARAGMHGPVGLALSGGIDSIAMAFHLRSIFPEREIHTYSAGYGDLDPEMATAAEVAKAIGAVHHAVQTPPSLVKTSLKKLVWHMEDPTSRSEALQLLRIGEVASGQVDVLLSGQGADGLFAGMPRHKLIKLAGRLPVVRNALFEIFDLSQLGLQPDSLLGRALALALYRGSVPPVPEVIGAEPVRRAKRIEPGPHFLNRTLAAGYQDSALQDAAKFERTFGASGLNYAAPCLDVSFARTAFTIDDRLKIRNGREKYIFRSALASVVPERYRLIQKHPQRMRYDVAFADCLDEVADALLSPASVQSRGFFEQRSVEGLRKRTAGKPYAAEAAMRLWTAVATEIWARLFLDGDSETP